MILHNMKQRILSSVMWFASILTFLPLAGLGWFFTSCSDDDSDAPLTFYSSVRLDVRRIESLKQAGEVIGNRTRVKVVKNKIAPPFKEAEFDIMFGKGISREGDLLDLAANANIITKTGAWYAYKGQKIGQGRENAKQYLLDNPDIYDELEKTVRDHYFAAAEEQEQESGPAKNTASQKAADKEE